MTFMLFNRLSFALVLALLLSVPLGCGGGGSGGSGTSAPTNPGQQNPEPEPEPEPSVTELPVKDDPHWEQAKAAARFLQQTTFGPTEESIIQLMNQGETAWLQAQLNTPATSHLEQLDARFAELGWDATPNPEIEGVDGYYRDLQRSDVWWEIALRGDDQLRQRVAFALSQIFVISNVSDVLYNDTRGIADYQDTLARHAFGNFRELLEAVTLHPMMGEYLSMVRNEKADPVRNIRPDENYAREVMQLFTIGLVELSIDGTVKTDAQGEPIATYNQDTIKAFARVFTGWNFATTNHWWEWTSDAVGEALPMKAYQDIHDTGEKMLLGGERLPAGQSAEADLEMALDNLFNHSNVGPFIAQQLIKRLVTSNPSPGYVERVARVFNDNGFGVRGDLKAVIRTLLTDPEARNGHLEQPDTAGKLREPVLQISHLWRVFKAEGVQVLNREGTAVAGTRIRYRGSDRTLGQRPYGSFSVFNFYRPDYAHPGTISDQDMDSPEFQLHTESVMIAKTNALTEAIFWRDADADYVQSQRANHDWDIYPPAIDMTREKALSGDAGALIDRLDLLLTAGQLSDEARQLLIAHIETLEHGDNNPHSQRVRVFEAASLIAASPYFAVQR
ncbi:DUF1800 domain-containing protein [Gilvimarinus algae]|uniref:DUF1800 domain-containing protein n=1 Tax=Gilvimarinus algae TaxID=3058037 RepID=A0ABT8TIS4_9GAMM|nr:DUF1800 domain-containing protein [Gilvimarinus sp. SDUM040014]MDO3383485.1 DUF1800 domain-containing protein [Gilvimarinus sp. SDUM040014]